MYAILLAGFVVGGALSALFFHVGLVIVVEPVDHYISRRIDFLPNRVPQTILIFVWFFLFTSSLCLFAVSMAMSFANGRTEIIASYSLGVGLYFLLVPFRITFLPLMLGKLFPGRKMTR